MSVIPLISLQKYVTMSVIRSIRIPMLAGPDSASVYQRNNSNINTIQHGDYKEAVNVRDQTQKTH